MAPSNPPGKKGGKILKTLPAVEVGALGEELARAVRAPLHPVLVVIAGNDVGRRFAVERSTVIGRDPEADFVVNDPLVSGRHVLLEDRGQGWDIVDLGSTNGTTVNGKRGERFSLSPNDKFAIGRTILKFELKDTLEQAYDEAMERLLNVDDLSGLYVRRKFDAELALAIERARPFQRPVGLLMMDLDGIKKINDTHGHLFGAYTIGTSGRVISGVIGELGFASRFGGDEFVAALPESSLSDTVAMGEKILAAIGAHHFERDGIVLKPGISIGAAGFPDSATEAVALFERADEALYRAKRAGKNRVSV